MNNKIRDYIHGDNDQDEWDDEELESKTALVFFAVISVLILFGGVGGFLLGRFLQ